MFKFMRNSYIMFFLFLLAFCSSNILYSQYSITGHVYYSDNNAPVINENVYALIYDSEIGEAVLLDSASLSSEGVYNLFSFHQDSVLICSGWIPKLDDEDHVSTYYPSTINWEIASHIFPPDNPTSIDIFVNRIIHQPDSVGITGCVYTLDGNLNRVPVFGATVVAKQDSVYWNAAISDSAGNFTLDSLGYGTFTILADKIGYHLDSLVVNTSGNYINSNNYLNLNRVKVIRHHFPNRQVNNFYLKQNYPNPFNPITTITFNIPITIKKVISVRLIVYDLLGRKVQILVDEILRPGIYKVKWDASNLSSGTYIYELRTDTFREVRKMLLIK